MGSSPSQYVIPDRASRYLIKCESVVQPDEANCRPHFERAFREFGLPRRIRSDNGPPFASKAVGARVNVETDILGKYVVAILKQRGM